MNAKTAGVWTIALLLCLGNASAQDDGDDNEAEITIRLMGAADAALPDSVTDEIALPEWLREDSAAVENARFGIDTANGNRERRDDGLATADEARERAAEMAGEAQENRENRGRAHEVPDRPDMPEPPDVPDPPIG